MTNNLMSDYLSHNETQDFSYEDFKGGDQNIVLIYSSAPTEKTSTNWRTTAALCEFLGKQQM